ncbi:MAG TPA: M14 metallopeptidase family protein [Candidatus Sulfopaludibacter sp.]|nr:M14 metallopeptidase family protein [Candidatus Sulfopaludibacter sp.]
MADGGIPMKLALTSILCVLGLQAAVQSPEQYFGFRIGADKKLVRYDKAAEYFQKLAAESDRVRYHNLGPTTLGAPFVMLEISSADNLKNLDHWKGLERKLYFQGGAPTDAERDEIFRTGKSVVFITNNIHSTEIGASQMVLEAVYRLATDNSPEVKRILDNVVLLLVPSLNPDGQMMVTDWYNKVVDTPNEASPMPWLYHAYTGHDNNRDMYLFSQKESRMAAQVLWHDWFPSIWLDEHQQGASGPRIFTMPATDPINPNVDPVIYRLNTIYGQSQAAALEVEGKTGIIFNATYTNFWEGAMAWAGWWHNQVGLLTEVASARIATPVIQQKADPSRPGAAAPAPARSAATGPAAGANAFEGERRRQFEQPDAPLPPPTDITPRTEYPRPWLGGKWTLRDIVDYELTATFALLETAADNRETLLRQIYAVNRNTIEAGKKGEIGDGKSFAVLIPTGQHDPDEAIDLVNRMMIGGVEVYRAKAEFQQDGKTYAAGTYVIPFTQVFARYAKDMLEKQTYPEVRRSPGAPAEAPYDVSAWSLGMQFGVKTDMAKTPLSASLPIERVAATPKFTLTASNSGGAWRFPYNGAQSALVVNRLLKNGAKVSLTKPDSSGVPMVIATAKPAAWTDAVQGFDVQPLPAAAAAKIPPVGTTLNAPRIGIYQSWDPSMDEGWTRFVLDDYQFTYVKLHNDDIQAGKLRDHFDAIVLPDQRSNSIMQGLDYKTIVPEYKGGLGDKGFDALKQFVADGGTLIALGEASNLLVDKLPLGVKDLKRATTRDQHFAPGTIVNLQVDTAHPIGWGVAPDTWGYYINSPFFQLTESFSSQKVSVVARYPNTGVNASGWLRGEDLMYGRAAVVSIEMGQGKVVLFGIRPQHRAQTHATLPLLFNALYWSAEGDLAAIRQ